MSVVTNRFCGYPLLLANAVLSETSANLANDPDKRMPVLICRKQKSKAQVLVSDSESDGAADKSAEEASDFSAESESQQSESSASSEDQSEDESPPPAKRGKKVQWRLMLTHCTCCTDCSRLALVPVKQSS